MKDAGFLRSLLRVAWLAIGLGVAIEVLLLVIAAAFGTLPVAKSILADVAQKLSWSTIVCVGVALGRLAAERRVVSMGLLGLLSAPLAFIVARGVHQGVAQALEVAVRAPGGLSAYSVAVVKGVEYACLGAVVGRFDRQANPSALAYGAAGLAAGLVFGGTILFVSATSSAQPPTTAQLVAQGANEVIFPVGCALVLFATTRVARGASEAA